MARGQQAVQAQQKNAKRKEKARKAARNKGTSQPGVLNAAAAAKSAKCKICMQLMQQLAADKPGSLKPLTAHVGKHKGKAMVDCFPDWTPEAIELKLNPTAAADAAIEPYDEYSAEVAVKAYAIEERKAAIEETGGKDPKTGIKGYKNIDFVYSLMGGDDDKNGLRFGDELQVRINEFSTFVQDSIYNGDENSGIHDLARNADQIPMYQDDPPVDPSFTALNFGFGTSAGAGLATISQLQADIINLEIKLQLLVLEVQLLELQE